MHLYEKLYVKKKPKMQHKLSGFPHRKEREKVIERFFFKGEVNIYVYMYFFHKLKIGNLWVVKSDYRLRRFGEKANLAFRTFWAIFIRQGVFGGHFPHGQGDPGGLDLPADVQEVIFLPCAALLARLEATVRMGGG